MHYEEFKAGQVIESVGRTVTEGDIVNFAGLTGDFNQLHTDKEFSGKTPFGHRIAHGLLGLSIASGLAVQTGFMEGTIMAFREISNWRFKLPILIGDTIRVKVEVLKLKDLPRMGGGAVTMELRVINQREETVQKGNWTALISSAGSA